MKLRSKTMFLVISMLVLSLVTGSVAPLAAPAEASTRTTLNGQTVETRRVGAVRGRGGVELARAASLEAALERRAATAALTVTGPGASVDITAGTMHIRHDSRELFILADTRTAFLTRGIGTATPSTVNVTLSTLPRTVGGRDLFVPFVDVVRNLGGTLSTARVATLTDTAPVGPATAHVFNNNRDAVTGINVLRMVGRGATFPNTLYGNTVSGLAIVAHNPWLQGYLAASQDLTGAAIAINERIGYNRINHDGTTRTVLTTVIGGTITFGAIDGSGMGVDAVRVRQAHFGGTDMLSTVPSDVLKAFPPIPTVKGGVALIHNVTDTAGNRIPHLNLTADVIAGIYLGRIENWNDPAIQRLNPRVAITNAAIEVSFRSDASGTTEIFTAYLNAASRVWRDALTPARRTTVEMDGPTGAIDPVGVIESDLGDWSAAEVTNRTLAAGGGGAMRTNVRTNANSIGYVSYGDAVAEIGQGLYGVARVQNRAGIFVLPLLANVYAAGIGHGNIQTHPVNSANPGAYPITGLTWIMVERDPMAEKIQGRSVQDGTTTIPALVARLATDVAVIDQLRRNAVVVDFIRWAVVEGFGDAEARRLHMAPLTPAMKREVDRLLGTIQVQTN